MARVGNSETDFYFGPEVIEPQGIKAEEMRDATGALKRQAARFRVFGYNRHGQVVKELNLYDPQLLSKETKNSCREGDMDGVAESTEITYQVMHITLKSGEAFPQGTMNLSKDGKTIVAHLICKDYFNSMVLCN